MIMGNDRRHKRKVNINPYALMEFFYSGKFGVSKTIPFYVKKKKQKTQVWRNGSKYSQEQNIHFDGHWKSWLLSVI